MRFLSILAILIMTLILSACGGGTSAADPTKAAGVSSSSTANLAGSTPTQADTAKPTATPVQSQAARPTATPTKSSGSSNISPSSGKIFSDVPDYPGAKVDGSLELSGSGLNADDEYEKVEWRALTTKDAPDKVLKFYKEELVKAKNGWTEEGWFEFGGEGMGAYIKDNGNKSLALIIGRDDATKETSIILAVGEGKKK